MKRIIIQQTMDFVMGVQIQNDEITDFFALPKNSIVGNIYCGRIENIRKNHCFVNFDNSRKNGILEINNKKFKVGDFVKCQIIRDDSDEKGAILSDKINLAGKYVILCEGIKGYKFSHRISVEDKKNLEENLTEKRYGFIVRKNAEKADFSLIENEIDNLIENYEKISIFQENVIKLIYSEIGLEKLVKEFDFLGSEIIVDTYEKLENNYQEYRNIKPIFDYYNLSEEIKRIFSRKISIENGIEIVFDKTEAMHVIDVNSKNEIGNNVFLINKKAAKEITKQIRLRNISGMILIDFVSMKNDKDKEKLIDYIKNLLKNDREKTRVESISEFSLVAINRKKRYNEFVTIFYKYSGMFEGENMIENDVFVYKNICDDILRLFAENNFKEIFIVMNEKLIDGFIEGKYYQQLLKEKINNAKVFVIRDMQTNDYKLLLSLNEEYKTKAVKL